MDRRVGRVRGDSLQFQLGHNCRLALNQILLIVHFALLQTLLYQTVAVIRIEAVSLLKLGRALRWLLLVVATIENFVKTLRFYVLYALLLVQLVHGNSTILQCKEEEYQFVDLILLVLFLLLHLAQLLLQCLVLDEQVKFALRQHLLPVRLYIYASLFNVQTID